MQYRHRFDILADILRVARPGAKKTRIMFFANLSYALLTRYLDEATNLGFLHANNDEFLLTSKGEEFLEKYNTFKIASTRMKADLDNLRSEEALLEKMCGTGSRKTCKKSTFAELG